MYITRSILRTCVLFNDFTKKLYIKFTYTFTIFYVFLYYAYFLYFYTFRLPINV